MRDVLKAMGFALAILFVGALGVFTVYQLIAGLYATWILLGLPERYSPLGAFFILTWAIVSVVVYIERKE